MFKKLIVSFLALALVLSITACGEGNSIKTDNKSSITEEKPKDAVVKKALELIDSGDIEGAYDLLYNVKDRNDEQQELFQKFAWVKTDETRTEDGNTVYSLKSTYNTNGYLVSCDFDSDYGYSNEKIVYDKDNNLLSYEYNDGSLYKIVHTYDKEGNMLSSKYGEYITEEFTYHSNGEIASYTYKTPDNAAVLYGIYGPKLFTVTYDKDGNILTEKRVTNNSGDEFWYEEVYTYDKDGNMLTEDYTDSSGNWEKYLCTYDNKGNELTVVATNVQRGDGKRYSYTTTYTYDKNNNVLTEYTSNSDGTWEKTFYTYDKNGNVLTKIDTDSSGKNITITNTYDENSNILKTESSEATTTYSYDKNGNKLSQYHTTKNGGWTKENFTYDNNSRILTRDYSYLTDSGEHWEKEVYTYDANGNLLSSSTTDSNGKFEYITNIYDDQGRIISYSKHNEYKFNDVDITYTYDKHGNQIYDDKGYTYTCDKYGNVIKADYIEGFVDAFGLESVMPDKSYSYKLFYYPDGAPWVFDGLRCHLSSSPRTDYYLDNPVTKKREILPTSNFYYRTDSY